MPADAYDEVSAADALDETSPVRQEDREERELNFRAVMIQNFQEQEDLNRAILLSLQDDTEKSAGTEDSARLSSTSQVNALPPPSEDAILDLMAMGFEREQVVDALRRSRNDIEGAANRLLS